VYSALSVAQAILGLAHAEGKSVTNIQLQQLVFFAHGYSLGALDAPLIDSEIMAWNFGPVIPRLYNALRHYGLSAITDDLSKTEHASSPVLDPAAMGVINAVWKAYQGYDAFELLALTHRSDTPWDIIWNKRGERFKPIPDDVIKSYYKQRVRPAYVAEFA